MTVKQCRMVNNTCNTAPQFMLRYDGYSTQGLAPGTSPAGLQAALNSLPSVSSAGSVSVSLESSDSTERVYRVKFVFAQPETTAMLEDGSQFRGFVSVMVDKAGIRSSKGFSLSLDGVRSLPIHADNTQEEMNEVLKDLLTTRCSYSTRFGKNDVMLF